MNVKSSTCCFLAFLVLISCNNHPPVFIPSANNSTSKKFVDAEDISVSWPVENKVVTQVISEPENLHPTNGNSAPRSEILFYTQRTLLYIDFKNQSVVPGLVKSLPEISGDGLRFTYEIRDDVTWDDGKKLLPGDFIFTAKAFCCPLTNDPSVRLYWENIDTILTYPENQGRFTIVMKKKYFQNITFLTGFSILEQSFHDPENILSSYSFRQFAEPSFHAAEHADLKKWANEFNDDKYGRNPEKLNGLGMYKVTQWQSGQYITIERKKNHWSQHSTDYHELSYPEKIIFKLNRDDASVLLGFRSQETDVSVNLSVGTFIQLNSDEQVLKNYNLALMPTYNYTYICFNEKPDGVKRKKLFDDILVRHAFAFIAPVDKIIRLVYKQYSDQCHRIVSNVSPLKKDFNKELAPIPYDLQAAVKLLKEAGWKDSDGDGILDKMIDGEKVNMTADLNYLSTSTEWKDIALLFAEEMAKAGVRIIPIAMDMKLFIEKAKSHDFDLILGSWGGSALPEDYTQLWHSASWINHGSNYSGFGNAGTDALIDSIKYEMNDSLRNNISRKLQQKIYDDQPFVFLYSSMRRNIIHKRFANQLLFSERPGILENMLRLLSINKGIIMNNVSTP